jgi:hypothetical protein
MNADGNEGGSEGERWLAAYVGQLVVVDLDQSYLVIGRLARFDRTHLSLDDADLHDHQEANCSKEVYLLESRTLGVRANRTRVDIPRHRMLAISRLEEVVP